MIQSSVIIKRTFILFNFFNICSLCLIIKNQTIKAIQCSLKIRFLSLCSAEPPLFTIPSFAFSHNTLARPANRIFFTLTLEGRYALRYSPLQNRSKGRQWPSLWRQQPAVKDAPHHYYAKQTVISESTNEGHAIAQEGGSDSRMDS